MFVIGDLMRNNARRIPEREALVCGAERLNWRELNRSVNELANGLLANGIKSGDRAALILGNTPDAVRLYYAIAKIGCTSVPMMPRSVAREIVHIVNDVAATAIVATPASIFSSLYCCCVLTFLIVPSSSGIFNSSPIDQVAPTLTGWFSAGGKGTVRSPMPGLY